MASPAAATRPPWLPKGPQLETFLEDQNPAWPLKALREDHNNCGLVNSVLEQIVSTCGLPTPPTAFEMYWARTHLAVDLHGILQRWCAEGWERTMKASPLRGLVAAAAAGPPPPPVKHEQYDAVVEDAEQRQPRESTSPVSIGAPRWTACNEPSVEGAAGSSSRVAFKRPLEDVEEYPEGFRKVTKIKASSYKDKSKFTCPYYAMDVASHPDCANKYFPNPRKLKEHVWRWLKPFKCPNCGEGFGREKTRAIHCDQRKTKCKKNESTYEGSAEHRRDQKIESSKTTKEMVEIFQDYEREKHIHQNNAMTPLPFRDPPGERSPSPESQNDSQNQSNTSVSDGESDSGDQGYTSITSPTPPVYQGGGGTISEYTIPQQHEHVQRDGEVGFTDKEAPATAFEARRSSLTYSTDDYRHRQHHHHHHHQQQQQHHHHHHHQQQQQQAGGYPQLADLRVPEIIVTKPDPQMEGSPARARSDSNSFAHQQQQQRPIYHNPTRSRDSPVGIAPGYFSHRTGGLMGDGETSNAIASNGFGSFAPFMFAMSF